MQKDDSDEHALERGKGILQEEASPPSQSVLFGKNDVLMGRGKRTYAHEGNAHFRKLVLEKVPAYLANEKNKKARKALAQGIVDQIESTGGVFLRQSKTNGEETWEKTPRYFVVVKVKQALRDKASDMEFLPSQKNRTTAKSMSAKPKASPKHCERKSSLKKTTTADTGAPSLNSTQSFAMAPPNTESAHQAGQLARAQPANQSDDPQQLFRQAQLLLSLDSARQRTPEQQLAQQSTTDLAASLDTQRLLQILRQGTNGRASHHGILSSLPIDTRLSLYHSMQSPYNHQSLLSPSLWNVNPGVTPPLYGTGQTLLIEAEIRRLLAANATMNPLSSAHLTATMSRTSHSNLETRIGSFLQNFRGDSSNGSNSDF